MSNLADVCNVSSTTGLTARPDLSSWQLHIGSDTPISFSSPMGTVELGMTVAGHDTWRYHQNNGGGALALCYAERSDGTLVVAMLRASRDNLIRDDGKVDIEVPGGFIDRGESPFQGAARELFEEVGVDLDLQLCDGVPFVGNRSFEVLWNLEEGTHVFVHRMTVDEEAHLASTPDVIVVSWAEAVTQSRDGLSVAALARLRAMLDERKTM